MKNSFSPVVFSWKNIFFFVILIVFSLFLLVSCGDTTTRDDSYDRQMVQQCLDENGIPVYDKIVSGWDDKTIIDYIACDKP